MTSVDIALLGATGFTGGLTAEYLGANLPAGKTWAVAGRNREKLNAIARQIADSGGVRPKVIEADVTDDASLAALAAQTRVLVSTVGPYLEHGRPAVKAAVEAGITYLDLTGEPQFVDQMWLEFNELAIETGAKIVHAVGFDCIPADLGVLFAVRQLPPDAAKKVRFYVRAKANPSGGTAASAIDQMGSVRESAKVAKMRRNLETRPVGRRVFGGGKPGRNPDLGGFRVPLPLLDPLVVLRSARALPEYGPSFDYEHYAHIKTPWMLAGGAVGLGGVAVAAQVRPLRRLMKKAIDQGTGPSEHVRAKSWFRVDIFAEAGDQKTHVRVTGGDPGYTVTSQMLAEAAMCAAFDDLPEVSGQLTTAVAFGDALIDRINPDIVTFQVL